MASFWRREIEGRGAFSVSYTSSPLNDPSNSTGERCCGFEKGGAAFVVGWDWKIYQVEIHGLVRPVPGWPVVFKVHEPGRCTEYMVYACRCFRELAEAMMYVDEHTRC